MAPTRSTPHEPNMTRFLLAIVLVLLADAAARAEVKLVATTVIPGSATDLSGLTEKLSEGTPHNRLGGFGSAIVPLGKDRYILLPDRGPQDGAAQYQCRLQIAQLPFDQKTLSFKLLETVILRDAAGKPFLGDQSAGDRRLDPEGMALSPGQTVYVSDEYGPKIVEFDLKGKFLRELKIPDRYRNPETSGNRDKEAAAGKGRAPNRGFEGLTITPAGKLVAILQGPLLQDGGGGGRFIRMLEIDPATSKTREFVYKRESKKSGANEILALSNSDFLVLERDSSPGSKRFCKIFRVSLDGASDVAGIDTLPEKTLPDGIQSVRKTEFLDLANHGLMLPEKVEGICFGPNLGNRRTLLVATDNDFTDDSSFIYLFSFEPSDLP